MKLYELYIRSEVSMNKETFIGKVRSIYSELTYIEKIMVDKQIIINSDYPSYYWKLIAAIHYSITNKNLDRIIDDSYNTTNIKNQLEHEHDIDDSIILFTMNNGIGSLYDLYVTFKIIYKPFQKTSIDKILENAKYDISIITSINDKLLLLSNYLAKTNKLYTCEIELVNNPHFLRTIDFNNFYESLTNFKKEEALHISWSRIDYRKLEFQSREFKTLIKRKSNKYEVLLDLLNKKYLKGSPYLFKAFNIIKMLLSNEYDIKITDLYFILDLCQCILPNYVDNILFYLKLKKIPLSILMSYNRFFGIRYMSIESTLTYSVKNLSDEFNLYVINILHLTNDNILNVMNSCRNMNVFKIIIEKAKSLSLEIPTEGIKNFILKSIMSKEKNTNEMILLFPYVEDIIKDYKYEILASYIEIRDFSHVKTVIDFFNEFDLYDNRISLAIGKSCSLDMFYHIYDVSNLDDRNVIKNLILGCLQKGNPIFLDYYLHLIEEYNISDILHNICLSENKTLMEKYIGNITVNIYEISVIKTIESDNTIMFLYLWSLNRKYKTLNLNLIISYICKHNRHDILNVIFNNIQLKLVDYLKILYENCTFSSIFILNVIFNKIGFYIDLNDPYMQFFKIGKSINRILNLNNKKVIKFLYSNIKISPLFKLLNEDYITRNKRKCRFVYRYYNDMYLSEDDE